MAIDKKQKSKYDEVAKINVMQTNLVKQDNQEFVKIVKQHKNTSNNKQFDPDTYRDKKKMSVRQSKLTQLELQKAELQKKDMENRVRIGELKGDTEVYKKEIVGRNVDDEDDNNNYSRKVSYEQLKPSNIDYDEY